MAVYNDVHHGNYVERVEQPVVNARAEHKMNVAGRAISLIGGIIMTLLALRFLLALLGANTTNAFASFIYTVSRPFAQPFFGLFNYQPTFGRSSFELSTLVAIVVYGLVTYLLVKLVTLGSHRDDVVA